MIMIRDRTIDKDTSKRSQLQGVQLGKGDCAESCPRSALPPPGLPPHCSM